MNDDTKPGISAGDRAGGAPGGPAGSSAAPTTTIRPPLLRSTEDRMVSGVCGGLGEHFGLDPVIFRIVFAVLSLFGGVGVLVYSLGWLLIPARGEEQPMLRRILSGKFDYGASAATVVAVMGVALFFTYLDSGFGRSVPLLMITAVVLFMVWSDTKKKQQAAVGAAGAAAMAAAPAPVDVRPDGATVPGPPMWWQVPGASAGAASGGEDRPVPPPAPHRPRRPRSYVSLATLSVATMAGGLLWVLDHTGAVDVTFTVALAILLGIVGLGLLAGSWFGRARLLILPALALTAMLAAITAISVPLTGPSGERTYRPTTVAALPTSYHLGVGAMDIDLRRLDLGPGGSATVKARIGAGQIQVWVPDDVTVVFKGGVDLGRVRTPTGRDDGYRPERIETTAPRVGPGRGTITLDLKVGVGEVEVLDGDDGREPR
ncbi:PspC domain-containing protein [Embleya sp. NPDC050493]|uniref:PspC domain-containing protein n=1 Tax=Embleya sp. NPDC050493 TaxID=3363989 RepID=UPI00378794E6